MILLFSIAAGWLYQATGRKNGNRAWRRFVLPGLALVALWTHNTVTFNLGALVTFFALNSGVLSTYHDYLGKPGTTDSGEPCMDETPLSWAVTGLFYGLAAFPLLWCSVIVYSIILRSIVLAILIPLIRRVDFEPFVGKWIKENAITQESLSGFVYILTLGIL